MSDPIPSNSAAPSPTRSDGPLLKVLIGSILLALLIAILIPVVSWLQAARFELKARRCPSNLRQIGLAMLMYANDHGGQIPPTPDLLLDPAADGVRSEEFVCPFTHDHPASGKTAAELRADLARPGHNSYVFTGLTGQFNDLTIDHVLAYDRPGNHTGANVLYGDGHGVWLDDQQTAHLIAELNAGHNPPRPATEGQP